MDTKHGIMNNPHNIGVFEVNSSNINSHTADRGIEQIGFFICRKGHISLMMDRQRFDLLPGSMFIFNAFLKTSLIGYSDDLEGIAGGADFEYILSRLEFVSDSRCHIFIHFHPMVSLTTAQYNRLISLIDFIRSRLDDGSEIHQKIVAALIQAFCFETIDTFIKNYNIESIKQSRTDKVFEQFIIMLNRNARLHHDVKFYADNLNLTPRYFSTLIRRHSGRTPIQWISLFVIIEAKRMLANPTMSIKEVAGALNFPDQSFIGRYFRQYAGMSPSRYREASHPNG